MAKTIDWFRKREKLGKESLLNRHEKVLGFFAFRNKQWKSNLERLRSVDVFVFWAWILKSQLLKNRLTWFCDPAFFHVVDVEISPKFASLNKIQTKNKTSILLHFLSPLCTWYSLFSSRCKTHKKQISHKEKCHAWRP